MFGRMIGATISALVFGAAGAWADCDALARAKWAGSGQSFSAEASAQGPTCDNAVVTMVLRDPNGKPVWVESFVAAQVMPFAGVVERKAMTAALAEWIDQKSSTLPRSDKLPDWPEGAEAPQAGEFPFYPDEGVDREFYMKLRGQKLPLFCYVQGMESMACVALDKDGGLTKVGVQTFPG
jgi:hypothetical protein